MKTPHIPKLACLLLGIGLTAPTFTALADAPSEPNGFGGHGGPFHGTGRSLALPATTACLENQLAQGTAAHSFSGIAVAIVLDGHLVYHRGFGTVSPNSSQPVQTSTRFRIASVTKPMTATALLSLVDDGRIRLHAPATALMPGMVIPGGEPGWNAKITAHTLMTHQAALEDGGDQNGPTDDAALIAAFYDPAFLETVQLMVEPGTMWNYSNPNFMLAGALIQQAAGRPYIDVMRRRVFKPLGMTRATFKPGDVLSDTDFAYGVMPDLSVIAPDAYDSAIPRASSFAWMSVDDLARYGRFLLEGDPDVLSPRMWRKQQTRQVSTLNLWDIEGYAYGLLTESDAGFYDTQHQLHLYKGVKVVWHDGALDGYQSFLSTLPGQRFAYAALINGNVDNAASSLVTCYQVAAVESIGSRLPPPAPWPAPDVQRDRFVDYVGNYADRINLAGPAILSLTASGDLSIRFPMLDGAIDYDPILHPIRRDNFVLNIGGASFQVTGIREGGSSAITYLRTRPTVFARTPPSTPAAAGTLRAAATQPQTVDIEALKRALQEAAREPHSTLISE